MICYIQVFYFYEGSEIVNKRFDLNHKAPFALWIENHEELPTLMGIRLVKRKRTEWIGHQYSRKTLSSGISFGRSISKSYRERKGQ